jgi:hypothetical protein
MIMRAALSFPYDSALPRDVLNINPHFNGPDAAAVAAMLKSNLLAYTPTADKPWSIKIYDAKKPPPSYPLAQESNSATTPNSSVPREVALCLSYYAVYNRPSFRGRLYLPASWFTSVAAVRPAAPTITAVLGFATSVLTRGLPAATFWTVYSKTHGTDAQVTDIWADDEWDTIRSRGLKPTSRQTAKV